jgi:dihydrofolate reductase
MIVSIIAAVSQNQVVGDSGKMPWKIPAEMKFFKEKTLNHPVIMGRKTWDSLYIKPLPKRMNVVITRNEQLYNRLPEDNLVFVPSLEDALNYVDGETSESFIIGGPDIWKYAIDQDYVDRMYINVINKEYPGDAYFPYYDQNNWVVTENPEISQPEFKNFTLIKKSVSEV